MKRLFCIVVAVMFLIASCNEDDGIILSNKLALKEIVVENNQVKLEWNRPYIHNFSHYVIYRTNDPFNSNYNYYYESIVQIYDIDETIYFDNLLLEEKVYYTVVAYSNNSEPIISNSQEFSRDDLIILDDKPNDIVHYPDGNKLLLFVNNKIYSLDYELMQFTDSIILSSNENFGSIGNYNGNDELYVACSNGYVRIYDINSLNELNQVYIGGNLRSVVPDDNGNLFIKSYDNWDGKVYSYKRSTLNQIDIYSGWFDYDGVLKHLSNSNRIIEITSNISPVNLIYYDHDNEGNFTNVNDDIYHGDHPLNYVIFETFPEGDYFITDKAGAIYNSSLYYVTELGDNYYDYYNHFFIDDYIYAASGVNTEIRLFSKSSYSYIKSYSTSFYPVFVFKDNNELVVVGSDYMDYQYYGNAKFTIEKINLN